ncbi:hypothetical protein FZZ91_07435 [Synechococcus sp. HB1133]|nr:hypothetical protein [Synechococcus sp. PH41509]MCB4422671.1 hypothetical protein [Synechococcus sp. HB1133]MCB4430366.1 hypothetical protein [Synechococcus sp. HBA1120]NHI81619.1 hypothetical protein [Synechococcus sp. HB1133]
MPDVVPQASRASRRLIVARSKSPHQLAISTLRTLEQRLSLLEEEGRYECAYALRMEVADWLLGARDANLSAPSFL